MKHRHSALFSPILALWIASVCGGILLAYAIGHLDASKAIPPASTVIDADDAMPRFHPSQFHPFVMGAV